jgi:hypothetical protein
MDIFWTFAGIGVLVLLVLAGVALLVAAGKRK